MAGGDAGAWWRARTMAGRVRWRGGVIAPRWVLAGAHVRQCGHDGGAVNEEEHTTGLRADKIRGERIYKWRFRPFG